LIPRAWRPWALARNMTNMSKSKEVWSEVTCHSPRSRRARALSRQVSGSLFYRDSRSHALFVFRQSGTISALFLRHFAPFSAIHCLCTLANQRLTKKTAPSPFWSEATSRRRPEFARQVLRSFASFASFVVPTALSRVRDGISPRISTPARRPKRQASRLPHYGTTADLTDFTWLFPRPVYAFPYSEQARPLVHLAHGCVGSETIGA